MKWRKLDYESCIVEIAVVIALAALLCAALVAFYWLLKMLVFVVKCIVLIIYRLVTYLFLLTITVKNVWTGLLLIAILVKVAVVNNECDKGNHAPAVALSKEAFLCFGSVGLSVCLSVCLWTTLLKKL